MRTMTGLPVDDDILDRILTFLPDFNSLYSCILVCSTFHKVYARHPKSICRKVASSIVGPVDAALDVILFENPEPSVLDDDGQPEEFPVQMFCAVPRVVQNHDPQTFSWNVIKELESVGQVADDWEDDFWLRWKDPRGAVRLSPLESFRFRRAVYRLMLFHKAYDFAGVSDAWEHDEDSLPSPSQIQEMFQARVNFLGQLLTDELHEMQIVATYMTQIKTQKGAQAIASPDEQLSHGPGIHFSLLDSGDAMAPEFEPIYQSDLVRYYFFSPLEAALTKSGAKLLPNTDKIWDHILDERCAHDDPCSHCGLVGPRLWSQNNWALTTKLLDQDPPLSSRLIPLRLRQNIIHGNALRPYVSQVIDNPAQFFSEVFAHKPLVGDFANWTTDQATCEECLVKISWDSFPRIWRARLLASGETLPSEDCWYGWTCRTQTHSQHHASRLNHFCRPTRGE